MSGPPLFDPKPSDLVCPECNGKRESMAHLTTLRGEMWVMTQCSCCDGKGTVSQEKHERFREGERLREDRMRRGLTLRKEAERLGISPLELSRREWGRES